MIPFCSVTICLTYVLAVLRVASTILGELQAARAHRLPQMCVRLRSVLIHNHHFSSYTV